MAAVGLHIAEEGVGGFRFRHKERLVEHGANVEILGTDVLAQLDHHILDVEHTDDVVDVVVVNRNAVVARFENVIEQRVERLVDVKAHNIAPRHADLARGAVVEGKD